MARRDLGPKLLRDDGDRVRVVVVLHRPTLGDLADLAEHVEQACRLHC